MTTAKCTPRTFGVPEKGQARYDGGLRGLYEPPGVTWGVEAS
jgi:hypothetical protein